MAKSGWRQKKDEKWFYTTVTGVNEEELKRRVDDNISRGFEVVATKEEVRNYSVNQKQRYTDIEGVRRSVYATESSRSFKCEMRRRNNEYKGDDDE